MFIGSDTIICVQVLGIYLHKPIQLKLQDFTDVQQARLIELFTKIETANFDDAEKVRSPIGIELGIKNIEGEGKSFKFIKFLPMPKQAAEIYEIVVYHCVTKHSDDAQPFKRRPSYRFLRDTKTSGMCVN